jgi:hypothetical protein
VTIEPLGNKGPDLGISRDGYSAIVEIMRFRKVHPGPPMDSLNGALLLSQYGNPVGDIRKAFGKLLAKFPQVKGENAIIAIWNDDGDLEELEVHGAVTELSNDAKQGILSLPCGLLFVIYGSPWLSGDQRQLYCFPFLHQDQTEPIARWQGEFETVRLRESIERALAQQNEY